MVSKLVDRWLGLSNFGQFVSAIVAGTLLLVVSLLIVGPSPSDTSATSAVAVHSSGPTPADSATAEDDASVMAIDGSTGNTDPMSTVSELPTPSISVQPVVVPTNGTPSSSSKAPTTPSSSASVPSAPTSGSLPPVCSPKSPNGGCYSVGDPCPKADAGQTGITADGTRIECMQTGNRYRWQSVN